MSDTSAINDIILQFGKKHGRHPCLKFISEDEEGIRVEALPDQGIINRVLLVTSRDGTNSVILKYGTECPSSPALQGTTVDYSRQEVEFKALRFVQTLIPGCAPEVHVFDDQLHILAMEYLRGMSMVTTYVKAGDINIELAAKMAEMTGKLHYNTCRKLLTEEKWQKIKKDFIKCEAQRHFFKRFCYEDPFDESNTFFHAPDKAEEMHKEYLQIIQSRGLAAKCARLYECEDCFTHGDCYANSFLTDGRDLKFIDMEFAGPGYSVVDMAILCGHYVLAGWETQTKMQSKKDIWKRTELATRAMVDSYLKEFSNSRGVLGESWVSELSLLIGAFLFRGSVYPPLKELLALEGEGQRMFLQKGYNIMIKSSDIKNIEDLLNMIFT